MAERKSDRRKLLSGAFLSPWLFNCGAISDRRKLYCGASFERSEFLTARKSDRRKLLSYAEHWHCCNEMEAMRVLQSSKRVAK